jgi:hypothetical protein
MRGVLEGVGVCNSNEWMNWIDDGGFVIMNE